MGRLIFQIADLIYRFVSLNILWLVFTLAGLGIFGVMPSTVALFSIVREWVRGEKDIALFSKYYAFFKAEFVRSNILGLFFLVVFYVIYVNFSFVSYFYAASVELFIYIVIFFFAVIAFMTFINLFSVMAHYEYKTWHYLKASAGLVFLHPVKTILQIVWIVAYVIIAVNFPKVFVVIGVSVFAYILMSLNYSTFKRLGST
ncbi:DUF624 domain-containing protein [Salipaludibacillus agaradhaerens]|jgi:uncharacterized membrane protein YesL|uniref:DUF624 domain-containing protein n=1 Tax=Salipaludibacillus agaradhaerens TaxID=76935 RepID=A0A9Q4B5G2_SALAG|nr:DUF624 domain-containing protein [Salipaludibacillus agaradhaerens]MCR6098813.1 DUF624 domain-containing protein [Salipaludibacillus agaradhaerens]MCR6115820.1 DUF624 domain-containing protein [Salipaludibacillus agaradhaerens]